MRDIALTIIAAALLAMGGIAWSTKADRSDVQRLDAKLDRIIDVICNNYQNARACR